MKMLRRSVCLQSAAVLAFFGAFALLNTNAQSGPGHSPATPAAQPANTPDWPVNEAPKPATVQWDSRGLSIQAENSSLKGILNEIAEKTGAKLEGVLPEGGAEQRVFGEYGPGTAASVLAQLLNGSGYNVMLVGDQGQGTPREIVLSKPSAASNQPPPPQQNSDDDDYEQPDQPVNQDAMPQSPMMRMRRMQEMQQRQAQEPPPQPNNTQQQY
jgi:hypothetical protein